MIRAHLRFIEAVLPLIVEYDPVRVAVLESSCALIASSSVIVILAIPTLTLNEQPQLIPSGCEYSLAIGIGV
jgi:hypothetical protein